MSVIITGELGKTHQIATKQPGLKGTLNDDFT